MEIIEYEKKRKKRGKDKIRKKKNNAKREKKDIKETSF